MNTLPTQRQLEASTSIETLNIAVREVVESTDTTPLVAQWEQYLIQLDSVESSHKDFHMTLLTSLNIEKAINTMLRILITAGVTTSTKSYVERNVVASKIGKKLLPKSAKSKSQINRATTSLSLGLNVLNIGASMNLFKYYTTRTQDAKIISAIKVNVNLVKEHLVDIYKNVRANTIMLEQPKPHTASKPGGFHTKPSTMLNSSGFNSVSVQSQTACTAMNNLQDVQYAVRSRLTNSLLDAYRQEDKWYNEKGQFLVTEWSKLISDIKLAKEADTFYFAVNCDDRGRMYELSAYIKYQGDKYQKSMLEFGKLEVCTESGLEFLAIQLANEIYSDKVSFEDALEWVTSKSIEELRDMTRPKTLEEISKMSKDLSREEVEKLVKGDPTATMLIADYEAALAGKPIGTITHWDATNSGLQFYSLLGADKATASLCNVYDTGLIADAYRALADELNRLTESTKFNRSNVKKAFMTFLYGAMASNILHKVEDTKNGVTNGIAEFFPVEWDDATMWNTFEASMSKIAPSAISLMELMYTYNTTGTTKFEWTMPDGFKVETTSVVTYSGVEPEDKKKQVIGWFLDLQGTTHQGSASVKLEEYSEFSRSLAPNIIHSIDAYFGREVIRRLGELGVEVSFIHDSFGVHPNNAATLHQIAREVAADMLGMNLIESILHQLHPEQTRRNINKGRLAKGTLTREDILNSKYILR